MTRTEEQKAFIWKATDRKRDAYFNRVYKHFLGALNKQIAPVILAIEQGKDPEKALSEKHIQAAMVEVYVLVGVAFAKEQYSALKSHEIDYLTKAGVEESAWVRFMRRFALEKALDRIENITKTTKAKIRGVLAEAVTEGFSIPRTAALMKERFEGINTRRATVIARTEIVSSSNLGSLTGAKSTGLKLNKQWLSTPQPLRTREWHMAADDQIRDIDEDFKVNDEPMGYPGDPKGSASNTVMCRCTILYISK